FLVIAAFLGSILGSMVHRFGVRLQGKALTAQAALLSETSVLAALLLSAALMSRIEKRSFSDYALPGRGIFGRQFWQGAIWGFIALSALLLLMNLGHGFSFGGLALHGRGLIRYALL